MIPITTHTHTHGSMHFSTLSPLGGAKSRRHLLLALLLPLKKRSCGKNMRRILFTFSAVAPSFSYNYNSFLACLMNRKGLRSNALKETR